MTAAADRQPALALFEGERPRLLRIAHRMLGSVAEAEDVVQSAWLRWSGADHAGIDNPAAWLTRAVTRLAIDVLRSARTRREVYVGPWLPEPEVTLVDEGPGEDTLTTALMLALERLSPLERAAFLLHDVFGVDFAEVARTLGREEAACRQLAARARKHVRAARPRFTVADDQQRRFAEAFLAASRSGDVTGLSALLQDDVQLVSDGGGVRLAALAPIEGRDSVVRFLAGVAGKAGGALPPQWRFVLVDGMPGILTRESDGMLQTVALQLDGEGIAAIYVIRNPAKLRHLEGLL